PNLRCCEKLVARIGFLFHGRAPSWSCEKNRPKKTDAHPMSQDHHPTRDSIRGQSPIQQLMQWIGRPRTATFSSALPDRIKTRAGVSACAHLIYEVLTAGRFQESGSILLLRP